MDNTPLNKEQTIRFQIAMQMTGKTVDELDAVYAWVMGPKQTLLTPTFNVVGK